MIKTDEFPHVYNGDDSEQRYEFGYELGRRGSKLEPEHEQWPEIVMGWEDAQGDDYLAIVAPPKPPLSLADNEKIANMIGRKNYAERMQWDTDEYEDSLLSKLPRRERKKRKRRVNWS